MYTCFILRYFGLFLIQLQSKNGATLGNVSSSRPKVLIKLYKKIQLLLHE